MKPPFEIYHNGVEIADADGHVCTAEDPDIAREIVAALNAHFSARPRLVASSLSRPHRGGAA